jgi:hypothetical protein
VPKQAQAVHHHFWQIVHRNEGAHHGSCRDGGQRVALLLCTAIYERQQRTRLRWVIGCFLEDAGMVDSAWPCSCALQFIRKKRTHLRWLNSWLADAGTVDSAWSLCTALSGDIRIHFLKVISTLQTKMGGRIARVGQNHIYTVYIWYFWQGNHQIYGHIRCIYTVLANPTHCISTYSIWSLWLLATRYTC